jgi:hypothetical protein
LILLAANRGSWSGCSPNIEARYFDRHHSSKSSVTEHARAAAGESLVTFQELSRHNAKGCVEKSNQVYRENKNLLKKPCRRPSPPVWLAQLSKTWTQ